MMPPLPARQRSNVLFRGDSWPIFHRIMNEINDHTYRESHYPDDENERFNAGKIGDAAFLNADFEG